MIDSISSPLGMEIDSASSPSSLFRFTPDRSEKEEKDGDCVVVPPPPPSDGMDLFWNESENDRVGAGIVNVGNTCYLSASLQCVVHTVPMVLKLRSSYQSHSCADRDKEEDYFCSLCALRLFVDATMGRPGGVIYPYIFTNNLRKISNDFLLGQQEDAHEFLHCFLDNLHSCSIDPSSKDKPFTMDEDSLVKHVYGGRLISQLRCSECGYCSNNLEPLLDLSLEIDEADSLVDALKSFTKMEIIEEKFTCGGCKAQVLMEKQTKIDQAPEVISLHFKRFKNNGFYIQKINKYVEYPLELDLKPFISCPSDDEQTMYDLYAVLVHTGFVNYGHYYSCIRSSPDTWHFMNDAQVNAVSETDVLNENAYILFYIKKGSSPWFSTLLAAQKLNETSPSSVLDRSLNPSSGEETCSSSSSRETSERDEGTRSHIGVPCDLITGDPGREVSVPSCTSMEAAERDEGPCPYNDVSYDSVPGQQQRDSEHSHRSRETIERDEGPPPHNDTPSISQRETDGSPHSFPSNIVNHQNGTVPTSRLRHQSTKRTSPNHICIDMPDCDPSGKASSPPELVTKRRFFPRKQVDASKAKGKKEVGETTPTTPKNVNPTISKLLRGCPSSRRSSILRCLPPSSKNIGKRASRASSSGSFDKRMKVFEFQSPDGEECYRQHPRSLSPRSLRRGLF